MTPEMKERVVRLMKAEGGRTVLMCGDGANDVGALKQADIGVALLTGFGSANVEEEGAEAGEGKGQTEGKGKEPPIGSQQRVNEAFKKAMREEVARLNKEQGVPSE
jgi:cation-transporting ATPase 13A1